MTSRPATPTRRATAALGAAACVIALISLAGTATAAAVKARGGCAVKAVGSTANDATGQTLVCTKVSAKKAEWRVPALGSFLRPIPLGQRSEAGPVGHRFIVLVTNVEPDASAAVVAESPENASPAPAGTSYVRVTVEATFAGPAAAGSTDHVWYARDDAGAQFAASEGCGGGYGGDFDVTAVVNKGQATRGRHCFQVPTSSVASLRLRVDGFGDKPDVFFALR